MADGIEVEQMVESRPKKVNISQSFLALSAASFSRVAMETVFSACGLLRCTFFDFTFLP
jgi:hypothetical protein